MTAVHVFVTAACVCVGGCQCVWVDFMVQNIVAIVAQCTPPSLIEAPLYE